MAASCNSRKGCGWLPFVQGERGGMEAFAVVFASIVPLACVASGLLLAVLIPRPFSFLLSHSHIPIFIKGFRVFLGSLPLHLRQCYCPWHAGRGSSVSFLFLCVMHTVRRECMRKPTPT